MALKYSNNASTILSSTLTAGATTVQCASLSGFPALSASDYTYATIAKASSPSDLEIVKVTAISGDTATIVRAQQGTSALGFSAGDEFELRLTAGLLDESLNESAQPDFFRGMVGDKIFIIQTGQSNPSGYYVRSQANNVNTWYNPKVWDWQWSDRSVLQTVAMRASATDTINGGNWGWRNPDPAQSAQVLSSLFDLEKMSYLGGNTGNQAYALANEIQIATGKEVYVLNLCFGGQSVAQWQSGGTLAGLLALHAKYILSGSSKKLNSDGSLGSTVDFQGKAGPEIVTWGQGETNASTGSSAGVNAQYQLPSVWAANVKGVFDDGKTDQDASGNGWIKDGYTKIFLTETSEYCNWTGTALAGNFSEVPWRWEGPNRLERYSGTDVKLISSMGIPVGDAVSGPTGVYGTKADQVHFTGDGNDMYGRRIADHILGKYVGTSIVSQELQRELVPILGGDLDLNGKSLLDGSYTYTLPATAGGQLAVTDASGRFATLESLDTITAAGNITTTGTGIISSASTITATGDISTAGDVNTTGTGGISSATTITAAGNITTTGTGNISSASTITATGDISAAGDVNTTGTGSISSNTTITATGDISTAGNVNTTGTGSISSASTITATGDISTAGNVNTTGTGSISSATTITAAANITTTGVGSIISSGAGNIATTGTGNIASATTITAIGDISTSGDVNTTGTGSISSNTTITAQGDITAFSDERLKENIEIIQNPFDILGSIRGVTFTRLITNERGTGVIAQEVQAVLPEAVKKHSDGMLSVAYGNMVGVLIEAVKELKAEITELKESR